MKPIVPAWIQEIIDCHINPHQLWVSTLQHQYEVMFLQEGLPTRRNERFKYADFSFLEKKDFSEDTLPSNHYYLNEILHQHKLRHGESFLLVLVNGRFMPNLSEIGKLPDNIIACGMSQALKEHEELVKTSWPDHYKTLIYKNYPFATLNASRFVDGLFLHIPKKCKLNTPIHMLSIITEQNFIAHPFHLIHLDEQSELTLIQEYFAADNEDYMQNIVNTCVLEKHAKLDYYKLQQESKKATHIAHTFAFQKQHSESSFTTISTGANFSRDEIIIKLQESGASCKTKGFYRTFADNQYMDHQVEVDHLAAVSESMMLYKGIMDNKSRAVFNGRLHVVKDAQKINAHQANHNLLLSPDAEIYSKPELEIYADDVKCKHGATIGQLDQEALFYLRARGIPEADAIQLLLNGFAEEIIQTVPHNSIRARIEEILQ